MIGENLNLQGDSLPEVFFLCATPAESKEMHDKVLQHISEVIFPELTYHLERHQILKSIHACKTVAQLEALKVEVLPQNLFSRIVEELNKLDYITDQARLYFLGRLIELTFRGAQEWVQLNMRQRAEAIVNNQKSSLITEPDGSMRIVHK